MTQLKINDTVQVTAPNGGLFYRHNARKTGTVVRIDHSRDHVHVRFAGADGTDYGNFHDVTKVADAPKFKVGDNVKVVAEHGGVFLSRFEGKTGKVVSIDHDDETLNVEFEGGARDYGNFTDVELVVAARREDQANNGMTVGDRIRVNSDESKRGSFYSRHCGKTGVITGILAQGDALQVTFDDGSKDCGYTHGVTLVSRGAGSGVEIALADMKKGMKVRYMGQPADGGHTHWGFELGKVYDCVDGGVRHGTGCDCRTNYGKWRFELVTGVEGQGSLSEQLAALRSQLNAIKTEKQAAEAEVAAARTKVNAIEARRVALVATLTAHGIQFIAE
ncbi:putative ribosomal protein L21e [Pseudomonas phage ventosus]|uniref:Putative ribosomal protein L21e n=1 Tax=Pseudomonas phage ventosus TaxID=2048980 RepID=A0A2H4P814_9CAUD|nr:putative ribosomal protein L21e [Pseudomonas phage ventosus]